MNFYHRIDYLFLSHPFVLVPLGVLIGKIPHETFEFLTMGSWIHWLVIVFVIGFFINRQCEKNKYIDRFTIMNQRNKYFEKDEETVLKEFRRQRKMFNEWKDRWLTDDEKRRIDNNLPIEDGNEYSNGGFDSVISKEIEKVWKEKSLFRGSPKYQRPTPHPYLHHCNHIHSF